MNIDEILSLIRKLKENQLSSDLETEEIFNLISKLLFSSNKELAIKEGCCSNIYSELSPEPSPDTESISIDRIEESLSSIKKSMDKCEIDLNASKRSIEALTTIQGELLNREQNYITQIANKDAEILDIKNQLAEAKAIPPLPADYQSLQLSKTQCEEIVKYLSEGRRLNPDNYPNISKAQLEEINKKNDWKNNKIKSLTDQLTKANSESSNLRTQLTQTQDQISQIGNQLTSKDNELEGIRAELDNIKRSKDAEIAGANAQIDNLQRDLKACQGKNPDQMQVRINQLTNQINQCNTKIPKMQAQIDKQKNIIDTQRSKIRNLESNGRAKVPDDYQSTKDELISLRNQMNQCTEEKAELQRSLTASNTNLDREREALREKEAENTQNQNLANLYKAEADKFKKEKEDILKDKSNLEKRIRLIDQIIADIPGAAEEGTTIELNQYEDVDLLSEEEKRIFESIDKDLETYTNQKEENATLKTQIKSKDDEIISLNNKIKEDEESLAQTRADCEECAANLAAKIEEAEAKAKDKEDCSESLKAANRESLNLKMQLARIKIGRQPGGLRPIPEQLSEVEKTLMRERDAARADLAQCKELWKANPITQAQATSLLSNAAGVGRN